MDFTSMTQEDKRQVAVKIINRLDAPVKEEMIDYIIENFDFSQCSYETTLGAWTLFNADEDYLDTFEDEVDDKFFG